MCFGGGSSGAPAFNGGQKNIIPIPNGNFVGTGAYGASQGAPIIPYQCGAQTGLMGVGPLAGGMQKACQSFQNLGGLQNLFLQNAQNSCNPNYNPGIGAFQSATNQNMQNTAAALASQRGASADPGLAARSIADMGARTQQGAVGQLGQITAGYKSGQMANALGAGQAQTQAAGVYGQIANSYANMGLQNQAQILQAIAAQNMANVSMQMNINSTNAQMFGQQLAYTQGIYGSQIQAYLGQLGYMTQQNQQNNSLFGGLLGGIGAGLALLNKGGKVGTHGYDHIPKYAKGGRIPDSKRRKMAAGGCTVGSGPFAGASYSDYSDLPSCSVQTGALAAGACSCTPNQSTFSKVGGILNGFSQGMNSMSGGFGGAMKSMANAVGGGGMARGGRAMAGGGMPGQYRPQGPNRPPQGGAPQMPAGQSMAMNGPVQGPQAQMQARQQQSVNPAQRGPMRGPGMPNMAIAGSPQPNIAMAPTGMPMGNAQTRGGQPLPSPGASGHYAQGGGVQQGRIHPALARAFLMGAKFGKTQSMKQFMPHGGAQTMPLRQPVQPRPIPNQGPRTTIPAQFRRV